MSENKFNVLLSFPRSGNTWVRYIVEYISKRPTCQSPIRMSSAGILNKKDVIGSEIDLGVDVSKKAILLKRHRFDFNWDDWNKDTCRLLFLIRDYREAIIRHAAASRKINDIKTINKCIEGYMHCLESFHNFDGDKQIIYYEDLILAPEKEVKKIAIFLNINDQKIIQQFFKHYNAHKAKSINYYKPGSMTKGNSNKLKWHSSRANKKTIDIIQNTIKNNQLYNKYLKRYG